MFDVDFSSQDEPNQMNQIRSGTLSQGKKKKKKGFQEVNLFLSEPH